MKNNNLYLVSTLQTLTTTITAQLGLNPAISSSVNMLVIAVMNEPDKLSFFTQENMAFAVCAAIAVWTIWNLYKKFLNRKKPCDPEMSVLELHSIQDNTDLMKYAIANRDFFDEMHIQKGMLNFKLRNASNNIRNCNADLFLKNPKLNFNDTRFGVKGYIVNILVTQKITEGEQSSSFSMNSSSIYVYPNTNNISAFDYLKLIQKYHKDNEENANRITLYEAKYYKGDTSKTCCAYPFYIGSKVKIPLLTAKLFKTFFHPEKERLLTMIDKVDKDPGFFYRFGQAGTFNALLYGPPGTGKSTFAYRLAQCLRRHLVSIDITPSMTKKCLKNAVSTPYVRNGIKFCGDVVVVFEEFDIAVDSILKKETEPSYLDFALMKEREKYDDKDEKKIAKLSGSGNSDGLKLKDLLEIIQGPVPCQGQIIIATTNNYDRIYEACPALFRPGRLQPIKFDYLKQDQVKKLAYQYLEIDIPLDFDPELPTSELIEMLIYAKIADKPDSFMAKLRAKCK